MAITAEVLGDFFKSRIAALEESLLQEYDPNEERDEAGKWSAGGGSLKKGKTMKGSPVKHEKADSPSWTTMAKNVYAKNGIPSDKVSVHWGKLKKKTGEVKTGYVLHDHRGTHWLGAGSPRKVIGIIAKWHVDKMRKEKKK